MSARCALGFVGLVSTLLGALSVPAQGRSVHTGSQHRLETCIQSQSDHGALVCCEDGLHGGAELSCCGLRAFDPTAATCCKVDLGNDVRANLTEGLSQITSSCCGLQAYHTLSEICCEGTVVTKPAMKARCCGKVCSNLMEVISIFFKISEAIDADLQLCCGPNSTILNRTSSHHLCCGHKQYNNQTHTCDEINGSLEISAKISARCGTKTYNTHSQLCCQSTVVAKPPARAKCCGNKAIDADLQLCCGPNSTILNRTSSHHLCCGHKQYNNQTHTCDEINGSLEISAKISGLPKTSTDIIYNHLTQGSLPTLNKLQIICSETERSLCGPTCYDPRLFCCCEGTQTNTGTRGRSDIVPTVYNPKTHTCCDGRLSKRRPGKNPIFGSLGTICCGEDVYQSQPEICCTGSGDATSIIQRRQGTV
ncbi:galaxin isoform X2 [Takifugu flavidus]|uniref:galaxin isoform X2 n=1 Tax=Takifugu flavidus TaxID=433684 RepID=UPI002544887F|nr:galaxin isoform X2 [Takifugu flavidus]XP_056906099.1 galaxin isoform X2 [Takifugu flavidus]